MLGSIPVEDGLAEKEDAKGCFLFDCFVIITI